MSTTESGAITSATSGVGPAPVADRILALDAVRGFALFGILVVNVLGISFFLLLDRLRTKNASVLPRYWRRQSC